MKPSNARKQCIGSGTATGYLNKIAQNCYEPFKFARGIWNSMVSLAFVNARGRKPIYLRLCIGLQRNARWTRSNRVYSVSKETRSKNEDRKRINIWLRLPFDPDSETMRTWGTNLQDYLSWTREISMCNVKRTRKRWPVYIVVKSIPRSAHVITLYQPLLSWSFIKISSKWQGRVNRRGLLKHVWSGKSVNSTRLWNPSANSNSTGS